MEKLKALKAAPHSIEFWGNDNPRCPHCGNSQDISRHEWYHLYDDNDRHEVTCPDCDLDFSVKTIVKYSFCTDEQDGGGQ